LGGPEICVKGTRYLEPADICARNKTAALFAKRERQTAFALTEGKTNLYIYYYPPSTLMLWTPDSPRLLQRSKLCSTTAAGTSQNFSPGFRAFASPLPSSRFRDSTNAAYRSLCVRPYHIGSNPCFSLAAVVSFQIEHKYPRLPFSKNACILWATWLPIGYRRWKWTTWHCTKPRPKF
jgi:hypothetical protein